MQFAHSSWELIVIDNGSKNETGFYLEGVQDAFPNPVSFIYNHTNLGFPTACNQGSALAKGEYLVLLNNDAIVTDRWLDQLIALSDSDVGMVGPMSNYVDFTLDSIPLRSPI